MKEKKKTTFLLAVIQKDKLNPRKLEKAKTSIDLKKNVRMTPFCYINSIN